MKRVGLSLFLLIGALSIAACGDDDPGEGGKDATIIVVADSGILADSGVVTDTGIVSNNDTGIVSNDTGVIEPDSGTPDGGMGNPDATADAGMNMPLTPDMEAGEFVQVAEGRINITDGTGTSANVDTFSSVKAKLGNGTRTTAMNTRSYEWTLSGGVELTIWFANTNLDGDDDAPGDVDDTDEVLWIAVTGTFTGKTSRDIGIGSTRADVEMTMPAGYGIPSTTADLTTPPGVLASYFTQGIVVAYDNANTVRTVTITRAYNTDPNADIQIDNARLDFALGAVDAFHNLQPGTGQQQVLNTLGYPDGAGDSNNFKVWSYAFIGVELFFFGSGTNVFFLTVHDPYFGPLDNSSVGLGATRLDFEAQLGLGTGTPSSQNANLICYPDDMMPEVLVSYTNGVASTLTMGFIMCP